MRRDMMADMIVISIASILLIVGLVSVNKPKDDKEYAVITDIPEIYSNREIVRTPKIDELVNNFRTIEQDNYRSSGQVGISIEGLDGGVWLGIDQITEKEGAHEDLKEILDSDDFKIIEDYTNENIQEDIMSFFEDNNKEDSISRVYSDTNTSLYMEKDWRGNEEYRGNIEIQVFDYEFNDTVYKSIHEKINAAGYSPMVSKDSTMKQIKYMDLSSRSGRNTTYIVDGEEVNDAIVNLIVYVKDEKIEKVSILANGIADKPESIVITDYQLDLISRVTEILNMSDAKEEIIELLFKSNTTKVVPAAENISGYDIKSSYLVSNISNGKNYRNKYHTRIDIDVE